AMKAAERFGRPTATGKVVLIQERLQREPGFLIYTPVFAADAGGRPKRLKGYVYSPFNARKFVESVLDTEDRKRVGIEIYDEVLAPENLMVAFRPIETSGSFAVREINLANHRWILRIEGEATPALSMLSLVTLLFGLLVATLLLVLARL